MTVKCPCCGGDMQSVPADALKDVDLPPIATVIVTALADAYPRRMTRQMLANRIYGLKPSGGPDHADSVVSVTISRTRPRLEQYGWTISSDKRWKGVKLTPSGKMVKNTLTGLNQASVRNGG